MCTLWSRGAGISVCSTFVFVAVYCHSSSYVVYWQCMPHLSGWVCVAYHWGSRYWYRTLVRFNYPRMACWNLFLSYLVLGCVCVCMYVYVIQMHLYAYVNAYVNSFSAMCNMHINKYIDICTCVGLCLCTGEYTVHACIITGRVCVCVCVQIAS